MASFPRSLPSNKQVKLMAAAVLETNHGRITRGRSLAAIRYRVWPAEKPYNVSRRCGDDSLLPRRGWQNPLGRAGEQPVFRKEGLASILLHS